MSNSGKRKRRIFSEQFKRDAVNLVVVDGYSFGAADRRDDYILTICDDTRSAAHAKRSFETTAIFTGWQNDSPLSALPQ